jgi:hypothetical protein
VNNKVIGVILIISIISLHLLKYTLYLKCRSFQNDFKKQFPIIYYPQEMYFEFKDWNRKRGKERSKEA